MPSLRERVWRRARGRCEYCQLPQEDDEPPFQVDHIRAKQHAGPTEYSNLALTCLNCNSHKGPNAAGFDPETDALEPLFNPRRDDWAEHFEWDGPFLRGRSAIGRTTVLVLRINLAERVMLRSVLIADGRFPPE